MGSGKEGRMDEWMVGWERWRDGEIKRVRDGRMEEWIKRWRDRGMEGGRNEEMERGMER